MDDYKRGMLEAAEATRTVGTQAEKLAQTRESMNTVGAAGLAMGAALAAGIGVAVSRFAEFDQAMSYVAATGDDARGNMDALRQAALDAGAATVFSATESANAIEEMAKAGVDAKDILGGGLKGALDLAAAGGLGVADAAGIAATALKTFKLEGSDMSHVADLLAAGAGKAMGDVSDLSQALAQGGQAAALTGLSIEETTAALAAFASQGLLGSDAGTSLKTMLLNLNPTTKKAADLVEQYNLQAFDQQGNFIGLAAYAGKLQAALGDMSAEQQSATLKTIFGTDAYRAAAVVLGEGEEGIRNWITAVDDQGYAAETAATRLDNLMGDWEAFTGALDTAFISMGEGANGPLRFLVQALTNMVDGFNALPDWAKQAALGVGILTAGVGLLGGGALIAIPKIAALKVAMIDLNLNGATARSGLSRFASFLGGPWGVAMAVATAAVVSFNAAIAEGQPKQEELLNSIATSTDSMESFKTAFSRGGLESNLFGDYAEELKDLPDLLDRAADAQWRWADLSFSEQGALDSIKRYGDALAELSQTDLPAAQAEFKALAESFDLTPESTRKLLDEMPALKSALLDQATAANIAEDSSEFLNLAMGESEQVTQTAADAYMEQADQVEDLNDQLMQLIDSMNEANGVGQDAVTSNIRYQETLATVNEAIANGASGLNTATEAGRANMDMLVGLASDAQGAAAAQFELDGSTQGYTERMRVGREALINSAMQMGATRGQAEALANTIYNIPSERKIKVLADTSQAHASLNGILSRLNEAVRTHFNIPVSTVGVGTVLKPPGMSAGGAVRGRGPKGKDSELRLLAPGEHVIPADEVDAAGGHSAIEEWRATLSGGRSGSQQAGSWVTTSGSFGGAGFAPQPLSLEGMSISGTLEIGGDGLARIIDGRIGSYDAASKAWVRGGVRS
ncbi:MULTISPECIES: phage tail tape measure protein [unclassified Microbacterium]|uniref:phage tail tape measure protein n=1 Tax=unclassified Microbacterium TaxID=2609290 RepID=UPI0024688F19|nr:MULTISPECIES: phage tail tape measure protein [unclassified Microbacterium]MDH5134075.1 phage tail tape measure protein [Microbacterium sp. RD10]MDH5136821.1 phage tail tape measure protein [Microbacterium sp. RD11]MDH5146398.1 phage tail tape measure protein [Microbacterium sp. RD12]MDH5155132.1 phage tail tape measure protein [Microbacterium sp. RD06]MDH5166586.1 phage tail tape measure protein [Microbacterium sp. RD02]